jgi:hypothetical protein
MSASSKKGAVGRPANRQDGTIKSDPSFGQPGGSALPGSVELAEQRPDLTQSLMRQEVQGSSGGGGAYDHKTWVPGAIAYYKDDGTPVYYGQEA